MTDKARAGDPRVEMVVVPRTSDLGDGFVVRRALPSQSRRMVGPFVFLDAMGPVTFDAGRGLDVRPHPHIGLATVTYLFSGEILHRDSLGSTQPIRPGELNWMTAGHGIVHSERTPADARERGSTLAGLQAWVALPQALAETSPAFAHHDAAELPLIDGDGARARVIAGAFAGARSPAVTLSPLFYVDVALDAGARVEMPREHDERAAFVVDGAIAVAGESGVYDAGRLVVMKPGAAITLRARTAAKLMLLGGAPLDGPRIVWWNFVASSRERIEAAKDDWRARCFARVPGDDVEFIPLPQDRPVPDVTYP